MEAADIATTHVLPTGNPYKVILRLATPTVIAMLSQSIVNEVDVIFFRHLPSRAEASNAQAALLPSLILFWLFAGSLSALSVGTQALVARRYAERNYEKAGAVLANAAWFAILGGAVLTVLGEIALPYFVRVTTDVVEMPGKARIMEEYSRWRIGGVMSAGVTMAIKAFFDGIGKTHVHLVAAIVMNVANVLFCWMFIFGHLGAPQMGAEGAGVAGFLATWIGLGIMLFFASKVRKDFKPVRWSNLSRKLTWDVLRLSIAGACVTIAMMAGFWLFQKVADKLDGDAAKAAILAGQVGATEAVNGAVMTDIVEILKLTFTACFGFGTATATLVSQSLGAKRPDEAAKYGWASVRLGLLIFGIVGLCEGLLFTRQIVDVIATPSVADAAMMPLRMMAAVTPLIAVTLILSEALFGAGNPRFVAIAQAVLLFGILVPGSFVFGLAFGFGLIGIWMSACLYATLASVVMTLKFRQGTWKTIKL